MAGIKNFIAAGLLSVCNALFAQTDSLCIDVMQADYLKSLKVTHSAQRQLITQEQIRAAGYTRLSDVMQLVDGWTYSTVNGDRWYLQSNGTSTLQNQDWVLMVNGQKQTLTNLDAVNLSRLGIQVNDIERIEIVNAAVIYLGEYADKGIIHIITKTAGKNGIFIRGLVNTGNETGDPGPYRYTPEGTKNVDRIGSLGGVTLGYRKNNFSVLGSVSRQDFYAQDSLVLNRYFSADPDSSRKSETTTIRFQSNFSAGKSLHQVSGFRSAGNDFTFNPFLRTEIKTRADHSALGYLFSLKINERSLIRFSEQYNDRRGKFFISDIKEQVNTANAWYQYKAPFRHGPFTWQLGIAHDAAAISFPGTAIADHISLIRPYTSLSLPVSRKSRAAAYFQTVFNTKEQAYKATFSWSKHVSILSNWSLVTSYTERLRAEDDLFYRISGIPYKKSRQATSDFFYNLSASDHFKLSFNSGMKYLFDQQRTDFETYDPAAPFYNNAPGIAITDGTSASWINRVNIYYNVFNSFFFSFNYMRIAQLQGDEQMMNGIPRHTIRFIFDYMLPGRFDVWWRSSYQSACNWAGYDSGGIVNAVQIAPLFVNDIGISKRFGKDHFNLNAVARNLFNRTERYHPLGAQLDLRFIVGIQWQFDGIFEPKN